MNERQWFGRALWLAVWLGWAYFGYWLYLYLPRTFVEVRKLPVGDDATCFGFIRDTRLAVFRESSRPGIPASRNRHVVFDATTGEERLAIAVEHPETYIRDAISVETGLAAVPVTDSNLAQRNAWGLEVVDLLSGERSRVPNVAMRNLMERDVSFHRSLRWIGIYHFDDDPNEKPKVAVYDVDSKSLLFSGATADEIDPTAVFASPPIFVDNARRFAVLVRGANHRHYKLASWELPSNVAPRRYRMVDLPVDFFDAGFGERRISDDERRIVSTPSRFAQILDLGLRAHVIGSPPLDKGHARTLTCDLKWAIDANWGRCIDARTGAVRWEWPLDESFVWHDGRSRCWFESAIAARAAKAWKARLPDFLRAVRLTDSVVNVRDFSTGRLRYRAFSPWPNAVAAPGFVSDYIGRRLVDDSGRYMLMPNGAVLMAEPRPLWGFIAGAQAIVGTPFAIWWLLGRWRRSRKR